MAGLNALNRPGEASRNQRLVTFTRPPIIRARWRRIFVSWPEEATRSGTGARRCRPASRRRWTRSSPPSKSPPTPPNGPRSRRTPAPAASSRDRPGRWPRWSPSPKPNPPLTRRPMTTRLPCMTA
ncbi:MAG: DNA-packaging protein, partial [Caulobacter sp.]